MSVTFTRKGAVVGLRSMNPRDAIHAIRTFAATAFVGTDGGCEIERALDLLEEELFPHDTGSVLIQDQRGVGPASYVEAA